MGSLFQVYNSFHLGAYQVAINEASDLLDLSPSESVEKDCYVYRSYIALGSYQLVMDEIPDDSPSALQAVKSLATYLANPLDRETQAQKMKDMLEDPAIAQNATVQLMAATIFAK